MAKRNDSNSTITDNQESNVSKTTATATKETPVSKTKKETKKEQKIREDSENAIAAAVFSDTMSKVRGKAHTFPATLEPTPKLPFEQTLMFTHYSNLQKTLNVRDANLDEANSRRLLQEIRRDGLMVALLCNINPLLKQDGKALSKNNPQRLKGNGRIGAIATLFEVYPDEAETLFPKGKVPFYGIVCSSKDAVGQIMDHGDEAPLETGLECMRMCWMLFGEDWTIQEVAIAQASTLARFSKKVRDGGGENWKLREGYLDDARLTPDPKKRAELLIKADIATVDAFYGQLQCRKREASLPYVVDALLFHKQGEVHTQNSTLAKTKFVPKLSTKDIIELERAFKKDRKKDKSFGKTKPGKLFTALWTKIIADQQKPGKAAKASGGGGRSKSASKLRDMADKDGMSAGVAAIINMAANTGDDSERAANLKTVDQVNEWVLYVEDGIRLCPEAYNTFIKAVMDARLEEEQEAAAAAEAAADETEDEVVNDSNDDEEEAA